MLVIFSQWLQRSAPDWTPSKNKNVTLRPTAIALFVFQCVLNLFLNGSVNANMNLGRKSVDVSA